MGFVSASATTGSCLPPDQFDPVVRCGLGDLPGAGSGNSSTVTVVLLAGAGGPAEAVGAVTTTVLDPVAANNTASETTLVTVPGGIDPTISGTAGGGTSLTWTAGNAESGYVIWRTAGTEVTRFPASGLLPVGTTSFVDGSPVDGLVNCYRVVPSAADGEPLAASGRLCQKPNTAAPAGALADFRLRFRNPGENVVRMDWSPFGGQAGYVIKRYGATENQIALPRKHSQTCAT